MTTIRVPLPGASKPETTIEVTKSEIEVLVKVSEVTNGHRTAKFWRDQLTRFDTQESQNGHA